ncbi:unnamed protein product [Linum trigynum]|uniref:Reverse transcriptase domain-containing protein n=1 Tax=Linum trigynum TaxID=586398 RepID=A0AAV2GVM8_9ROSI
MEIIQRAWSKPLRGTAQFRAFNQLKTVRHDLVEWERLGTSNSARRIRELRTAIEDLRESAQVDWDAIRLLERELSSAYIEEESFWRQKSRVGWLREGDANTKLFHRTVLQRRRFNRLRGLKDETGTLQHEEEAMAGIAIPFYQSIFSSNNVDASSYVDSLGICIRVTREMNEALIAPVSPLEVKEAVFRIGSHQAPGSDGFTAAFFQVHWEVVGSLITDAVLSFFRSGWLLHNFNHTLISLLPKVPNAESMRQIRPIGLCQVFYKIIAKLLAARLSVILPEVVSSTQNGFVRGRLITDNILIGQEVMQFLKTKVQGRDKWMALKLDMEKAYDRVEWSFLLLILERLGFCLEWRRWVTACISSVSFSVLINGHPHGYFKPQRGLRQGDPLSPLLYAIYTEAFSAKLSSEIMAVNLHGLRVHRHAPLTSHLLFADDTYLFLRASLRECANLLSLLDELERVSGQKVNLSKSSMCVSANVSDQERLALGSFLGVADSTLADKYLGLPIHVQRSKTQTFRFVEEGLAARIRSWKSKAMSLAANETVIKSIGSASSIYTMSAFRLPSFTCRRLNGQLSRFWWADQDKDDGIHLLSWQEVCLSKFAGGLGFRDFERFNIALLAKQAWRVLMNPDSTLASLYRARYHPHTSFLEATPGPRPSWAWQGMLAGRDLLIRGLRWRIGDGTTVQVLADKWLPSNPPSIPLLQPHINFCPVLVSELICPFSRSWNVDLLTSLFLPESVSLILSIPLLLQASPDKLIWHHSPTGEYTVKTGYHVLTDELLSVHPPAPLPYDCRFWKVLWSLPLPPKLKFFWWRVVRGFLPVRAVLQVKRLVTDNTCPICSEGAETIGHSFLHCRVAVELWAMAGLGNLRRRLEGLSHLNCWQVLFFSCHLSKTEIADVVFLCWRVWKSRCWALHKHIQYMGQALFRQFRAQVDEWQLASAPLTLHRGGGGARRARMGATQEARNLVPAGVCPADGVLVRFDGAWKKDAGVGIGFVGFSNNGQLVFAFGRHYPGVSDPFISELLALRDAVNWCVLHGFGSVNFCGDCQLLIRRIRTREVNHGMGGALLEEVCSASALFSFFYCNFTPRLYNRAAHLVASNALSSTVRLLVDCRVCLSSVM